MPKRKTIETKKTTGKLQTDLYDLQGSVAGKITLPPEIFAVSVSPALFAQAVRVYLANQRSGTHATKTRNQVIGSTRKINRQKGTGRARHGDIKAPIFVGGGIAHGPHPRDYTLSLPQKMKRKALFGALTDKLANNCLKVVAGLETLPVKTKEIFAVLQKLNLVGGKEKKEAVVMLVTPNKMTNIYLAGRNISCLTVRQANLLNTYEILKHKYLLLTKETIDELSKLFIKKEEKKEETEKAVKPKKIVKAEKPKTVKKKKVVKKSI
ncbi:50S ribosomal protein L4 [Candidatus Microgenomates bacterium]|nr:50S ribosomal protein L4 [Candidatus Microgenomates bacterium]